MEDLRLALERLNLPPDRVDLVQRRVEARLQADVPAAWCAAFRSRVEALMAAQIFSQPYAEAYHALRGQLVAQGIAEYAGEHGMSVPDEEIDRSAKKPATATRPPLPADFARRRDKSVPFVAPTPESAGADMTIGTEPPVVSKTLLPASAESVLDAGMPANIDAPTPPHRDHIDAGYCQRDDDSWVLECTILRGSRVQVCTITEDGQDVSFEMDIAVPASRIDLRLPAGSRPKTTAIVVLGTQGEELGRGLIGETAQ